ncbi:methyl-accepting chemotaxis protein [Sphingomonas sp. ID0503]|uniref:methyl-accepting chemotaxis protein n=1 Tax=Sphingomonas sp. ID0503 TaxID=3399691 RepID=UPI003AFA6543
MSAASDIAELRLKDVRFLALAACVSTALLSLLAAATSLSGELTIITGLAMVNIIPALMAARGRHDLAARLSVAIAVSIQPAGLVALMRGSAWQLDMHMYFFVALPALTILFDWRPIVLASVVIAVHHLLLNYVAPGLVFSGAGNVERVLVHALAVILQAATLIYVTHRLRALITAQAEAREESVRLAAAAEDARCRALDLHRHAESARAAAEDAERRAAAEAATSAALKERQRAARQAELVEVADHVERSIAGIAASIAAAATKLAGFATDLDRLAHETGRQAHDAADSAGLASVGAQSVAGAIGDLSLSIAEIARNAEQQTALSVAARGSSVDGDTAVRALARQTSDISDFVDMIHGVAVQTNLLALNATIEAARAGDAGRGFAVVAGEVKQLSAQASGITKRINSLLAAIHDGAGAAEGRLADIARAVTSLDVAAEAIRSAIEEQRRTATLIEEHARATAGGSDEIARRVAAVAVAARSTESLSRQVRGASTALLTSANALTGATSDFVKRLRAA